MRRVPNYALGAFLLAGVGLAVAWPRGVDPSPDRGLDPEEAVAAGQPGGDSDAEVRDGNATLSAPRGPGIRRAGVPGSVRVAVRRGDDGSFVPDVSVVLTGAPPRGAPFSLQAWTDLDGRAVFDRVPEGTGYRLVTQIGARTPVERGDVEVVAGLETDLGVVVLASAGIVMGMVLREDGSPIQDAIVTATTHPDTLLDLDQDVWPLPPEPPFFAAKTVTDLAGHIPLPGVPPGLVAIRATAVGFRGRTERTWVPPQATSPGWVDVVLRPSRGIRVRVVDRNALPLPGVPVSVGTWEDPRFAARVEGRTDEKGVYELTGFLRMPVAALRVRAPEEDAHLLFRDVGRTADARCVVTAASKVTVRVLGMEDDRPVPGAQVMLDLGLPPELRYASDALLGTALGETDARGEVTLPAHRGAPVVGQVRSARRRTVPLSRGAPPASPAAYRIDGNLSDPLEAGETRLLTVHVASGVRLQVTVVDPRDAPVAGATVALADAFAGLSVLPTDAGGVATFDGVVPEHAVALEAGAPGFATTRTKAGLERGSPDGTLAARVRLDPGVTLRGVVNDGTGKPLPGARVQAEVGGPFARTGADGAYTLEGVPVVVERRVRPTLRVRAQADGFAARSSAEFPVHLGPEAQPVPPIVLGAGNEIRGVVLDPARNRVPYPVIEVVGDDGASVRTGTASAVGEFTLRDVPPGTWRLVALARGQVGSLRDPVKVEDDVDVPFQTIPTGPLVFREFQLVDRSGKPVAGARLEDVLDGSRSPRARALGTAGELPGTTDAEGRLLVAAPSLPRTVRVSLDGFDPEEIDLRDVRGPKTIPLRWRPDGRRGKPR